jgi:hypothetical protein
MSAKKRTNPLAGLHLKVIDGRAEMAGKHPDEPATVSAKLVSGFLEMTSRGGDIRGSQFLHGRLFDGKQTMGERGRRVNAILSQQINFGLSVGDLAHDQGVWIGR